MLMMKRGQYSLEYLFTMGFVLMILLGFLAVYWNHQRTSNKEVDVIRIKSMGNEIMDNIKSLHSAGGYSVKAINFPNTDVVKAIYVKDNYSREIVINYTGGSASFYSDFKVAGLINKSKVPATVYIMKSNTGDVAICSEPTCKCRAENCCSLSPLYCGRGECRNGTSVCVQGTIRVCAGGEIRPVPEIAGNGLDDDCDGTTS